MLTESECLERVERPDVRTMGLECRHVGFSWDVESPDSSEVLRDISLQLKKGEFVSVIGPSGCGKSTLLSLLCGLLTPTSGKILIEGKQIDDHRKKVGMVFQDYGLFPWLTVENNVQFGMRMNGVNKAERKAKTLEILTKVGLLAAKKKYPHELSGGMKQRVSIARVLANNSQYLLMDEPFGALDQQTRLIMQRFLLDIWKQFNKAILFVTHQVEEALMQSERVILMTARPGTFIEEIRVDLPYPREATNRKFNDYRVHIAAHLEREVLKGFEEQEQLLLSRGYALSLDRPT